MNNKEIFTKNVETETFQNDKFDLNLFKKKSSAKTPAGIVLGFMKKLKNSEAPLEFKILLQEIYKKIWSLEESEKVRFETWRGKSGVYFIIKPDRVIAVRYRKPDKFERPKEVKIELTKQEINQVSWAISKLNEGKEIPTSEIGEKVYGKKWKDIFSNRKQHIKLVEILNYLEYKGWIHYYRSGKIKVLKEIQEVLK